jgi:hypothetical protein
MGLQNESTALPLQTEELVSQGAALKLTIDSALLQILQRFLLLLRLIAEILILSLNLCIENAPAYLLHPLLFQGLTFHKITGPQQST